MNVRNVVVGGVIAVLVVIASGSTHNAAAATDLGIDVPTKAGEIWYVCQGYNTSGSHSAPGGDKFGLDLVPHGDSDGNGTADTGAALPGGCKAGYNAAAHRRVYTPVDGWITWKSDSLGLVCISLRSGSTGLGKSIKVGHMKTNAATTQYPAEWRSVPVLGRVHKGYVLGYVATANSGNAGIPHIHISMYTGTNCGVNTSNGTGCTVKYAIPFSAAYGTQLHGITYRYDAATGAMRSPVPNEWDLYCSSGRVNQWSKQLLWRSRTVAE